MDEASPPRKPAFNPFDLLTDDEVRNKTPQTTFRERDEELLQSRNCSAQPVSQQHRMLRRRRQRTMATAAPAKSGMHRQQPALHLRCHRLRARQLRRSGGKRRRREAAILPSRRTRQLSRTGLLWRRIWTASWQSLISARHVSVVLGYQPSTGRVRRALSLCCQWSNQQSVSQLAPTLVPSRWSYLVMLHSRSMALYTRSKSQSSHKFGPLERPSIRSVAGAPAGAAGRRRSSARALAAAGRQPARSEGRR